MTENLFEPGGSICGSKGTGMKFTEATRLRKQLNEQKTAVLFGENIKVDTTRSVLEVEGQTYLLPVEFTKALKEGRIKRSGASPQELLEPLDGPLELKAQNWDHDTDPIYWLHITEEDSHTAYPVYGYGADYGTGYHVTPLVKEPKDWSNAEWLCRCAQCGRELPSNQYYVNTNGRLKGICKGCISINNVVDKIFGKSLIYRSDDETDLLVSTRHWYEGLWKRNLCPRGNFAEHCIGKADIKERMRRATKHKRGSTQRTPQITSQRVIQQAKALMDETKEN